jgi:hypothetical protein
MKNLFYLLLLSVFSLGAQAQEIHPDLKVKNLDAKNFNLQIEALKEKARSIDTRKPRIGSVASDGHLIACLSKHRLMEASSITKFESANSLIQEYKVDKRNVNLMRAPTLILGIPAFAINYLNPIG